MADLVFEAPPVKKKTPIHLADLNLAERKERAVELGLPAFRANQLAVHFLPTTMMMLKALPIFQKSFAPQ